MTGFASGGGGGGGGSGALEVTYDQTHQVNDGEFISIDLGIDKQQVGNDGAVLKPEIAYADPIDQARGDFYRIDGSTPGSSANWILRVPSGEPNYWLDLENQMGFNTTFRVKVFKG